MRQKRCMRERLVLAGLIGAGIMTLTWWTMLAAGLWSAYEWAMA